MKNHPFEVDLTNEETYVTLLVDAEMLDVMFSGAQHKKVGTPYKDVLENQRKRQLAWIDNERKSKSKDDIEEAKGKGNSNTIEAKIS